MTWTDAGFPDITLRPWGKVMYALFLGLEELALAMGVKLNKYTSLIDPSLDPFKFVSIRDRADYTHNVPLMYYYGHPNSAMSYFDAIFRPLLYYSFRAKYCLDHLVYSCTDAQMLETVNTFLGEELIHPDLDYPERTTDITGPQFALKQGYFPKWAAQRYRLIRNMPIFAPFGELQINAHLSASRNYYFQSGIWKLVIEFQRTWLESVSIIDPGDEYGYFAWMADQFIAYDQALLKVQAVKLQDPDFPFRVIFLHRANVGNSDFGTGLQDGQIWTEDISGFGERNYSYTFPPESDHSFINQDTRVCIQVLPQNNPWITGGINV